MDDWRQREVRKATRDKRDKMPGKEELVKANAALMKAKCDEMDQLNKEPLTTGALFLAVGALLDFAEEALSSRSRGETGGLSLNNWFEICTSPSVQMLLEEYLTWADKNHPFWKAYDAQCAASIKCSAMERQILDEAVGEKGALAE